MKRQLHFVGMPLLLICFALSCSTDSTEKQNNAELYEAGGCSIEAGFAPDNSQIILGQHLFITFTVSNRSEKAFRFFVGGDNRGSVRHNNFRITAVSANGDTVKDPYSYQNFGGMGNFVVLEYGESYSERLFLGHWCAFEDTGTYTVTCNRVLEDFGEDQRKVEVSITDSFDLSITPYDAGRMRDVIAGWGDKIRDGNDVDISEASIALATIADEQVIPYLAMSLSSSRGDTRGKLAAIQRLARFQSKAAVDALLLALKSPDHGVRERGGEALKNIGKLDYALQRLLPDIKSQSDSVRALTARALGATRARGAFDALLEATHDSGPSVRYSAAEGLGALGYQEAIRPLKNYLEDSDFGMRIAAAKGLHALGEPLDPDWLTPVIRGTKGVNDQKFHEAIRLIRLYGGERAAPALVSCLDFDDPSPGNSRNSFLITAIHYSPDGPKYDDEFYRNPGRDGTPEQIKENSRILGELKEWLKDKN